MANFAVTLVHGPAWDSARPIRSQDGWDGHAAFMDGLVDDGFIILGGPVGDGERTLHVVEAADEDSVKARLAQDPWALAGLLEIGAIEPWALWLDSRRAKLSTVADAETQPVQVPMLVGMTVREARTAGHAAGVVVVSTDIDGPPLGALTWPGLWLVIAQQPAPSAWVPRWSNVVIQFREFEGGEAD